MLINKLEQDLNQALKKGKSEKVTVLRSVRAEIQNAEIDKKKKLNDQEVVKIIRQQLKKSEEAQALFAKGGREDLVEQNKLEQEILKQYLPLEISDDDLNRKVKKIISQHSEITNPGQLIGLCISELKEEADSARVAQAVKKQLDPK